MYVMYMCMHVCMCVCVCISRAADVFHYNSFCVIQWEYHLVSYLSLNPSINPGPLPPHTHTMIVSNWPKNFDHNIRLLYKLNVLKMVQIIISS